MLQSVEIFYDFTYFGLRENIMCAKWWHDRFWIGIACIPNLFEKILFRGESTFHINKWRSYIRKCNGMFIGWGGMACQTVTVIVTVREFTACLDGLIFCSHVIDIEERADRKACDCQKSN